MLARQRLALFRHADNAGEDADHLQDLGDAALVEGEHRIAALDEVVGDVGLQIREREDQVRLQRLDLFVARVQERRHLRLLARLRRPDRVAGDADHAIAFTEEVQRFGGFLGEADDALGYMACNQPCHDGSLAGHGVNFRSAKTNPSRSTISPRSTSIGAGEHRAGITRTNGTRRSRRRDRRRPADRAAASIERAAGEACDRVLSGLTHVSRACRPPSIMSCARSLVGLVFQIGNNGSSPLPAKRGLAIPANVFEKQIAERHVREAVTRRTRPRPCA